MSCSQLGPILKIVAYVLKFIQWGIPFLLIIFVTIDFVKSMIADDQKGMDVAKVNFLKRVLYAVVIFLIPVVVKIIFKALDTGISTGELNGPASWISCFNSYF